ncbi:MAG: universal stress protein [Haloferacaceae archaeon]
MYEAILIPYDGSDEAKRGAEHGIELAAALGSTVHAMYVIDLPGAPRSVYVREDEEELRENYREYGEEVTDEICEMAAEEGLDCETVIKTGSPAEEIVDYADETEEVESIVLGSAYKGTLGGLLGGTADKVVRSAPVPVTTYRMGMND